MTRIFAGRALLRDGWLSDVRLSIEHGRIGRIETGVAAAGDDARVGLVLPGLVNAHSHAFQRALVGRTEYRAAGTTDTFWTWRESMYRLAARLDAGLLRPIAAQAYAEMVAAGYTSVVEFHYLLGGRDDSSADAMLAALRAAADDAGIRLVYVPVLYETGDFGGAPLDERQRRFATRLDAFLAHYAQAAAAAGGRLSVGLGVHSLRAVSSGSLASVAARAAADAAPFHLHIAEQEREVERCLAVNRLRPVRWLFDHVGVDDRWTLVHATHIDPEELQLIARSGAVVCLCPGTEGNLGDGLFPLRAFLDAGGRIAIGSDSHVTLNPFEELRWLEYGQRLVRRERNIGAGADGHSGTGLFTAVAQGGRQSAGFCRGGIETGAPADLVTIDAGHPVVAGHGADTLLDALVFGGAGVPVDRVMVDGRWLVGEGRHRAAADLRRAWADAVTRAFDGEASA